MSERSQISDAVQLKNMRIRACNTKKTFSAVLRIRDPVPFWPQDPGSGMGKKLGSGSGMNSPDHIPESLETIFWVKILSLMRIWDGKNSASG